MFYNIYIMSLNFNKLSNLENVIKSIESVENNNENNNENENKEQKTIVVDNDCGICGSELIQDVVKLKCNHMFHFECISLSYKFSHSKVCPYCRKPSNIPTSKNAIKPIGSCEGILQSGKRKGEKCGCTIFKNDLSLKLCKRHFNVQQKKNNVTQ